MSVTLKRNTQSFGEDLDDPKYRKRRGGKGGDRLEMRLPPSEVAILRWVFSDLEGYMGLGSNFGRMCDSIQIRAGGTDPECWTVGGGDSDGEFCSKPAGAISPQSIYVHGTTRAMIMHDSPADGYVCWTQHGFDFGKPRLATAIGLAREALQDMVRRGEKKDAIVLATMYSSEPEGKTDPLFSRPELDENGQPKPPEPTPWRWTLDFKMLGDVVVLGTMTDTVLEHAEKMTKDLRLDFHTKCFERSLPWGPSKHRPGDPYLCANGVRVLERKKTADDVEHHAEESKLRVEPLEAMYDLLIMRSSDSAEKKKWRKAEAEKVQREANHLLVVASNSYRAARARVEAGVKKHTVPSRPRRVRPVDDPLQCCESCGRQVRFNGGASVYCGCGG
jgi:hypothetical protein